MTRIFFYSFYLKKNEKETLKKKKKNISIIRFTFNRKKGNNKERMKERKREWKKERKKARNYGLFYY